MKNSIFVFLQIFHIQNDELHIIGVLAIEAEIQIPNFAYLVKPSTNHCDFFRTIHATFLMHHFILSIN